MDVPKLTSAAYGATLAQRIKPGAVLPSDAYGSLGPTALPPKDGGTTHLAVIDAAGNAVSLTTTVNLSFGAHLVAEQETGIVLNNQMDDFVMQVGVPNAFGLIGNEQNAVAPGKRPLSSMTPTLVMDGDKVKVVVGGSGLAHDHLRRRPRSCSTSSTGRWTRRRRWWRRACITSGSRRCSASSPRSRRRRSRPFEAGGQKIKPVPAIGKVNVLVRTSKGIDAASEPRSPSGPAGY